MPVLDQHLATSAFIEKIPTMKIKIQLVIIMIDEEGF